MTTDAPSSFEPSWEPEIVGQIVAAVTKANEDQVEKRPYMVAMVGIPGSGKTVSGLILANMLEENGFECMVMPHDGYHFPLDHLRMFPDADDAIYRRGAPDTFDPQMLKRDLDRIRDGEEELIMVPGFDHGRGDPEPDTHAFDRNKHKVVLCEGLYLLHSHDGWEDIAATFDLKIFVDSDVDNCIERVKVRNRCIPGYTPEEIDERTEKVDRVNAMTVMRGKAAADIVVRSIVGPQPPSNETTSMQPAPSTSDLEALNLINQNDINTSSLGGDRGDYHTGTDWTADITSRSRSNSMASISEALVSSDKPEPPPASAFIGTWEPDLAERICKDMKASPNRLPYMVALVGTPGSGKSISSFLLANKLEEQGIACMVMPHDGYHYTMDYLKTFPDADDFIYRRGAPDTFDPHALKRDLDRIRDGDEEVIKLPAFDHARADPEPDTHIYDRNSHKVVVCEGLYLFHDQDGWEDIASVFDLKIFMNADLEICMDRVKIRNRCIPGYTSEEIDERSEKVDRVNALTVIRSKARADVVVNSRAMKK